jgi:hypothetical protein
MPLSLKLTVSSISTITLNSFKAVFLTRNLNLCLSAKGEGLFFSFDKVSKI